MQVSLPAASGVKIHKTGRLDDPAPANSAASRLPASLVSKLTLVPTEDVDESCISKLDCTSPTCSSKEQQLIPAGKQPRRPLIQEVVSP